MKNSKTLATSFKNVSFVKFLQEYGFDDLKSLADIYNNNIKKIIDLVKNSIKTFRELISSWKNHNSGSIIDDFVESVKALPKDVTNLRKVYVSHFLINRFDK